LRKKHAVDVSHIARPSLVRLRQYRIFNSLREARDLS